MGRTGSVGAGEGDLDRTFEMLAHRYRRWLLMYMVEFDEEEIDLQRATRIIGVLEPHSSSESVATLLHHNHLRRLDGAGIVDYDAESGKITFTGQTLVENLLRETVDWDARFAEMR